MVREIRPEMCTSRWIIGLCGFYLACGLLVTSADAQQRGGRRGWGTPEEQFGRMDRNGDGKLEAGELPGQMSQFLKNLGLDPEKGVSKSEYVGAIQRVQMGGGFPRGDRRRDGGGREGRRRDGEDGERRRDSGGRRSRGNEDDSAQQSAENPDSESSSDEEESEKREKPRVTFDLPEDYTVGDRDGDGQVTFFEWRRWNGKRFSQFVAMDRDGDGFLTPREIIAATGRDEAGGDAARSAASTEQSAESSDGTSDAANTEAAPQNDKLAADARRFFGILDADDDGRISPPEWEPSRRIREMFEGGGVDLSGEMSEGEFVQNYVRFASEAS